MNGSGKLLVMVLVGILIAAGIITGVYALEQQNIITNSSQTFTTSETFTSTSTYTTTKTSVTNSSTPTGVLAAQITDPPNVPVGTTHVYIAYSDIEVHTTNPGGASVWFTIASAGEIDLMSLVNVSVTLGSERVTSGVFDQIRFDIISATITYNGRNYTAAVPMSQISVPINNGGIQVQPNGTAGLVIDISPTVFPAKSGPSTSFVLVPAAKGLPIPAQDWNASLVAKGAMLALNDKPWWTQSQVVLADNVSVIAANVGYDYLLVILKNTGNQSVTLSSLSILSSNAESNATVSTTTYVSTITTVTTITEITTVSQSATSQSSNSSTGATALGLPSSAEGVDASAQLQTVAIFQILSNGSLVQPAQSIDSQNQGQLGYVLAPGKDFAFLYYGPIATLDSAFPPHSPLAIIGGAQYVIQIADPFGATYDIPVVASYQSQ